MIIVTIIAIGIQHILKSVVIFSRITVAGDSEIGACLLNIFAVTNTPGVSGKRIVNLNSCFNL